MKKWTIVFIGCLILNGISAQSDYDYYFVGDTSDVSPVTQFGVCLMGGAEENDEGSTWFLERAIGGNIVVIRASGSDGYNLYFYEDLGVNVQSVETIVFNNANASLDPFVQRRLQNAEAIWIAGGDQSVYEAYWKNTPIQAILNEHVNTNNAPIGGLSAGMAILGGIYFSASNGTINSQDALSNPMDSRIVLGSDFLNVPFMENVITDTHYDNPDRKGRHATFMARATNASNERIYGIGANEYTAICIADNGVATIYGEYPEFPDKVYFLQNNCQAESAIIEANTPLTWLEEPNAMYVYEVNATEGGNATFDLNTWESGTGGAWQYWNVDNGNLEITAGNGPNCALTIPDLENSNDALSLFPNPTNDHFQVRGLNSADIIDDAVIYDLSGRKVQTIDTWNGEEPISVAHLIEGAYVLKITQRDTTHVLRFHKK